MSVVNTSGKGLGPVGGEAVSPSRLLPPCGPIKLWAGGRMHTLTQPCPYLIGRPDKAAVSGPSQRRTCAQ